MLVASSVYKWYEHFKKLLGTSILAIQTGPFTNEEYSKVNINLIEGKYAVPDGIAPRILKYGNLYDIMLKLSNKILIIHEIPSH